MQERNLRESRASTPFGAVVPLLVLVMILFALVVGYGWLRLLATALDPLSAGFVAALITVISLLLARMIAKAWLAGKEDPAYRTKIFLLYPVLFIISALGTINAAFYNFEGSSVLQQVIDDAERRLAALDSTSSAALRNRASDARTAEVERLLLQLRTEILNPSNNCGVGTVARGIIRQIQRILPQFQEISQRSIERDCNSATLRRLADTYRDNALRMLNADPELQDRTRLRGELAEPLAAARRRLLRAETALATGGGFGNGYGEAQLALEEAATAYGEARERLVTIQPIAGETLPPSIDVARARYLGSITAMPGTLASRLNYFTTWVYILIAIFLDLFLIFLFVEGARTAAPVVERPREIVGDPQFLWVNQGA